MKIVFNKKKYLFIVSVLCMFTFTYCSEFFIKPPTTFEDQFTLFSKDHSPNSELYGEGTILQNQNDNPKFMLSARNWQGIPSIGKDRFGNLYVAWLATETCGGECNENYLTVSLSRNKGKSWCHNKLILNVNPLDSTRMKEANFFNDKFGNLYMYWGKQLQKKATKEWVITWYSKINLSNDGETINYSPPRRIAEGIMLNKFFYSIISNQVFFPIARWREGDSPDLRQPFIYKANYGLNNLTNFSKAGFIPIDNSLKGIFEHMIVQFKDSTYLGMVRTLDGIYYSKSKDGNTWEKGKKFLDLGATTYSRFHLGRLKSGRIILIFNNSKVRSNLIVCLSDDNGLSWPYTMVLDASDGVSYPDLIETDQGTLNIVYDYKRYPSGRIYFATLQEDEIIKNSKLEFPKIKISSLQ